MEFQRTALRARGALAEEAASLAILAIEAQLDLEPLPVGGAFLTPQLTGLIGRADGLLLSQVDAEIRLAKAGRAAGILRTGT